MGFREHPPQAVVFDLGKVLLDFDYDRAARHIAERCRVPKDEILKTLDQSSLLHRFETGLMDREAFFEEVRQRTGYVGGMDEFAGVFGDIFSEIPEMIAWQARLRIARLPTFIFSNTNDIAVAHIRRAFPFFSDFDGHVYSYQEGAMKPSARIYEAMEQMAALPPGRLFYVDDRAENVDAAIRRGWQAVLHTSPATTLAAAVAAGLPG